MTEIKYKDLTIPVEAGQTVTLNTADKKLTGDIAVTAPKESGGGAELIEARVTINNTATNYRLYAYIFSAFQQVVQKNSSRTFDIPVGAVVSFSSPDAVIAEVRNLMVTGEAEIINNTVKIKGDCTISVEPYDAD